MVDKHEAIAQILRLHPEIQRKLKEQLVKKDYGEQWREIQDWREERRKAGRC